MITVTEKDSLTNSSMTTFKSCRRKYYYCYEKLIRPAITKKPLRFGSAFHEGLDVMAKGGSLEEAQEQVRIMYDTVIGNVFDPATEYELNIECVTVNTLLAGYLDAWRESQIEIIESEKSFFLPIVNPETKHPSRNFTQAGKRDRLAKLPDGRIALMETKTVGEDIQPGSDYRNVLSINQQVSMYVMAALTEGIEVETTIYDCIRKSTIRPCAVPLTDVEGIKIVLDITGERVFNANGKPRQTSDTDKGYVLQTRDMTCDEWQQKLSADIASRPEYYFQRFEVPRLDADLVEFCHELWDISQDVNNCRRNNLWYRNTGNCRNYNSVCPYYGFCSGELSVENLPETFRIAETAHEELEEL